MRGEDQLRARRVGVRVGEHADDFGCHIRVQAAVQLVDQQHRPLLQGQQHRTQEGEPGPGPEGLLLPVKSDVPAIGRPVQQLDRVLLSRLLAPEVGADDAQIRDPYQLLDP